MADHLAHAGRDAHLLDAAHRNYPATVVPLQPAALLQMAQHFTDEEGIAFGFPMQRLRQRAAGRVERRVGLRFDQGTHFGLCQPVQSDAFTGWLASQCCQRYSQGVGAVQVGVAVGADEEQAGIRDCAGHVLQQEQRGLVGAVEIVEHHEDGG